MERSRRKSAGKSPAGRGKTSKSPVKKSPVKLGKSVKPAAKLRGRSRSRGRPRKIVQKEISPRSSSSPETDTKSKTPPKNRGRSKSPKTRGRSKSKSRRSTSRTRTTAARKKADEVQQLVDIVAQKKLNLVLKDVFPDKLRSSYEMNSKLNEMIRRSVSRDISNEKDIGTLRRSNRISTLRDVKDEQKKFDDLLEASGKVVPASSAAKGEFGGWPGALLSTILVPVLVLLLHLACTKDQCTLNKFHIPRNWRVYFNLEAAGIVTGFVLLQTLLSILPIGRLVGGPPGRNGTLIYRCNGLLSMFLTIAAGAGLWYFKFPVTIVYEKLIPLLVSSAILGTVLGLLLFIKGGRAPVPGLNPYGITGNKISDFYAGREVNPLLFGKVNVKTALLRSAAIGSLVLNSLLVLKAFEVRGEISYTLLTSVGLHAFIISDFFWFEDSFASTFEAMYEGTGAQITQGYLLYPFLSSLTTKYIIQHRVELPVYSLVGIVVWFLIGFFVYRASNLQKATFRKNPMNPALAQFETIPTSRGKKLLVSGWWGWVRHPNYLGDIVLHWACASTAGFVNAIPFTFPLLTTLYLLHRAKRDDNRCRQRYQSAWEEYCSRVRYRILPRVY